MGIARLVAAQREERNPPMKIVLTQDVEQVGEAGTVQDVKPGFARNYLIPKGLAQVATAGMIKQAAERQAAQQRRIAKQELELQSLADRIDGLRLEFVARAGEQGRLFGSVTNADIAAKLSQELGEEIDRRKVDLPNGIHEVGEFPVTIRLVGRLTPSITAVVRAEGAEAVEETADDETADATDLPEVTADEFTAEADVSEEADTDNESAQR